jgi:molybdopterin-guanine dinucleotide biosynthesis protein
VPLIRDGLRRGMGEVTYAQVRTNLDARLASGEFQIVDHGQNTPARQFTTARTIEAEHEIVHRVTEERNQIEPVLSRSDAIAVADRHQYLNRAQKSVVEDVLSAPDRVQGIQGYAGAGKTTTLSVIREAAEARGYTVEGFAPTSRAARQLNEAGVEAKTLQGFLAHSAKPDAAEQKHFYLVDESSLASTNQMREFLARLGPNDRVLLIGDTRQHQGVEAGRPFEQLQEAGMRTAKLDEIVRQKDPALKSAVEMLAKGQVSAALESLQQQGRIQEIPDAQERIRTIAKAYVESPEKTLIVSPDNASRRELNVAVREELKAKGALAPDYRTFRILVQRQDMTGAERTWASHYEINDVVRYSRGSQAIGMEAGSYGAVVGVNPAANLLTVAKSSGEQATYDPRRLTGVSVYREIDREFSAGDRIQFTAPDKALGVANRDLAAVESISPDGRISARLDNGRQIEFDATEHRHFDHGYAVTSHSSQGLTAERVLVNADTGVHPDLLNSRFGYVSISRASHEATLFTDDLAKLSPQLSADVSKTSALEINQPVRCPGNRHGNLTDANSRMEAALASTTSAFNGGIAMTDLTIMPENYDNIRTGIVELLKAARSAAARNVNSIMTATYWEIGRRIVIFEQGGEHRAEYGEQLVEQLARDLTQQFGRGFGRANLGQMRAFYRAWPEPKNSQTLSGNSQVPINQCVIGNTSSTTFVPATRFVALVRLRPAAFRQAPRSPVFLRD